jgi:hypothetical protein
MSDGHGSQSQSVFNYAGLQPKSVPVPVQALLVVVRGLAQLRQQGELREKSRHCLETSVLHLHQTTQHEIKHAMAQFEESLKIKHGGAMAAAMAGCTFTTSMRAR